ncbi:MAG: acyl-CoA dehydratase activase [Candidatus Bathyarchaeota archaeon]|jgi:predicted CoA-substrate-specific enzyme activase|nr:acyl-CoA dehydratase activase [Candidatus Bathyarchaeota archaeon]
MVFVGIDAGASATKSVVVDSKGVVLSYSIMPSGVNFRTSAEKVLEESLKSCRKTPRDVVNSVSTGYGRNLVNAGSTSSEIVCISRGITKIFPSVRTVIDVGGQDSKAIRIDAEGKVRNFTMNDKCAAGTGKFLEVMSNSLGKPIEELSILHFNSRKPTKISSTCTVFAESEVISHLSLGSAVEDVISGLHRSIANRVYSMACSVGFEKELAFTGGVAKNKGFVDALSRKIGWNPLIPQEPQIVCAFGAAITAFLRSQS